MCVCRCNPPLTRNQPRLAGSIKWSRSLFARIKQTMSKLYSVENEMMQLELGQAVHDKYMALARRVLAFEKHLYCEWLSGLEAAALTYLKQNILARDASTGRVQVNFSDGLIRLMRESRYLDRMGFDIPEVALNITLQEAAYLMCAMRLACKLVCCVQWCHMQMQLTRTCAMLSACTPCSPVCCAAPADKHLQRQLSCRRVEELQAMLTRYYQALASVPQTEQALLATMCGDLEASLEPGLTVLNWNSLGISDFALQCHKAVNEFNTRVAQVLKNKHEMEVLVAAMSQANLMPVVDTCSVPTLQVRL